MKLKVEKKYMFRVKNIERSFESQVENCWPLDFELLLSTWKLFFFTKWFGKYQHFSAYYI